MKNAAPGRGDRGRRRNEGGWESSRGAGKSEKGLKDLAEATVCSERALPLDGAVGPASRGSSPPSKPAVQLVHWCLCLSGPGLDRFPREVPRVAPGSCPPSASPLPPSSVFFLTCCELRKVLSEYHLTDAHQKPVRGAAFEVRTPRSLSQQLRRLEAGFKFRSAAPQSLCRRQCAIRCGSPRAASDSAGPSSQRLSWGPLSQSTPSPGENTMLCTEPRPEAGGSERGQVAVHGRQVGAVTHYSPRRAPR